MQLVVKLYNDKPSRIGVKFAYEYQAVREYELLIRKMQAEACRIKFELVNQTVLLSVESEENAEKFFYKDLEFKKDQFQKLLAYFSKETPFIFVHVFPKGSSLLVAKPFRKAEFLTVLNLELIGPRHLSF